jgi:hypothetical protein
LLDIGYLELTSRVLKNQEQLDAATC